MQNYYPWNTQVLVKWLNQELPHHNNKDLAAALKVPRQIIKSWLTEASPMITLAHVRAIAHYRKWNLDQVISWLGLQPIHVQELIDQDIAETNQPSLRQ